MALETCAAAVASGDGREVFSLQAGGQILHVSDGKCLSVVGAAEGSDVVFDGCDGAPQWEFTGNGQLRLDAPGDLCLSQVGLAPGSADVASNAAVVASSTVNTLSHGLAFFSFAWLASCFRVAAWSRSFVCRGRDGCRRRCGYILGFEIR